jgi:carbamate kinase
MSTPNKKLVILAVGGNSLILDEKHKTVQDQYDAAEKTCEHIAGLIKRGFRVLVTHGNGPQVGFILRRSDIARHELHEVPLDSCGADSQGAIGYQIQRAMLNVTRAWPSQPVVATVVTQVLVDASDPSFRRPSKPIGSFMSRDDAEAHQQKDGWNVIEDAGRGYRRVVASPRPKKILELDAIRILLEHDVVVVAVGGGGIPVTQKDDGVYVGADAVIDKDLATSLLAQQLGADTLIISTAVDRVYINYRKPDQRGLDLLTVAEARQHLAGGQFPGGSMGPKIEAAVEFLENGGREAIITDPPHLVEAIEGRAGTRIVP